LKKLETWAPLETPRKGEGKLVQPWIYRHRWSPARLLVDGMMGARLRALFRRSILRKSK